MYAYMWTWQDTAMDCMESCLESIAFLFATIVWWNSKFVQGERSRQEVTNRRPCKHVRCNASDKVDVIKAEQPNSSHTVSKPTNQQTSKTVNIGFYSREGV